MSSEDDSDEDNGDDSASSEDIDNLDDTAQEVSKKVHHLFLPTSCLRKFVLTPLLATFS